MTENITLIAICLIVSAIKSVLSQNFEGFVVDGEYATMKDFPHAAFLYIDCVNKEEEEGYYSCGSSILNQAIVITAAHCLENCVESSSITVHVGNEKLAKGTPFRTSRFIIHEHYDSNKICNDVALVQLKKNLKFGKRVRRISLMSKPPYHEIATVAGWGLIDEVNHVSANYLMQLNQMVWSRSSCIEALHHRIPMGTFCGGTKNAHSYVAPGDSGSGLLVRKYILIGLVSFKNPKTSKSLAVYTDLGYFHDWIKKTAQRMYCRESP